MYANSMQEVSRVRSTVRTDHRLNPKLDLPYGKEQIRKKKLNPHIMSAVLSTVKVRFQSVLVIIRLSNVGLK